ncbi:MAG: hypothetical protein MZW92_63150 [Comamonadaceae bacterium]|nr:hypothetical protein [Comamonadaceae bacterium]
MSAAGWHAVAGARAGRRVVFHHLRDRQPPGRAPAFMSPGAGLRPSPLLDFTPGHAPSTGSGTAPCAPLVAAPPPCAPRTPGGRIAEVKEEAGAAGPGDMERAGRPAAVACRYGRAQGVFGRVNSAPCADPLIRSSHARRSKRRTADGGWRAITLRDRRPPGVLPAFMSPGAGLRPSPPP